MGASGWDYIQPFDTDLQTTLNALRRRVFDEGEYFWFDSVPRPATLAELDAMFADEPDFEGPDFDTLIDVAATGTHSILDVRTVGPRGHIQQLNEADTAALFGTATPSTEDFQRADLYRVASGRWSGGFCVALHDPRGNVAAVGFWGISGD
jgi:hypothetical protein